MKKCVLVAFICCFILTVAKALPDDTTIQRKKYFTKQLTSPVTLDGIPNEAAWNVVEWGGDFIQRAPYENQQPSQPSNFKIIYDERFLYVGYRCFDSSPDSIVKWMDRRDQLPGDYIEIGIDSYHDLRTAFSFTISASGVRTDEAVSNDGNNWDGNWNPIWFAKTRIDSLGWTAEIKIPFSQLRYGNETDKVWGLEFSRRIFRKAELTLWNPIPQSSGVWVSRYGELHGLKNIPVHKQVEIAPYLSVQTQKYKRQDGNPYATGTDRKITAGVDGKVAITNDLILDYTINPDFGQVEADPSQVRIDGYQNFFTERRPFFIASKNIFDYGLTGSNAGGDYDSDLLFYSRRIGSSPHGRPKVNSGEYMKYPQNTSILGSAKFSGKTKDGWSIGVLESVTEREKAIIDNRGEKRVEVVEPLTSFFVGRVQKDFKQGNTVLGGIFTNVLREKGLNNLLHNSASSGGFDFLHHWKKRTYYIRGNVVFSHVKGSKQAILNTQTSFEHLFQRAGAKEFTLDSNRTSLTGTGGTFIFGKLGGKAGKLGQIFRYETGLTFRSPQLEINDIGFMLTSNEINHFTWAGLQFQRAFSIFRRAQINYNHWSRWDFGGNWIFQQFNVNANANFQNNWQVHTGFSWNPLDISNNALRGTTAMKRPSGMGFNGNVTSDNRKKIYSGVNFFNYWAEDNAGKALGVGLSLYFQPLNAMKVSLSGNYGYDTRRQDQFVNNVIYNNSSRTIVGEVKQKTLRFTARLSYNVTPDLTIQYYGQPYITRPLYNSFAYVSNPFGRNYDDRFKVFNPSQVSFNNGVYGVDENNDGITDYSFNKPDFNFIQFRSNMVIRWEYKAGSELYLVWSQGNTPDANNELNIPLPRSLINNAFAGDNARNIFLLKWTYRFLK